MANQNIKIAATQAGLSEKEKSQIDGLSKLLESHQKLIAMPEDQAKQTFANKPDAEKNAHVGFFGGDNPLGDALHYVGSAVKATIAAPFKALNEVSDFTTRLYRTGAIALDEGINLGDAFKAANDKGDKVFNDGRIDNARQKYGEVAVDLAMRIKAGEDPEKIREELNKVYPAMKALLDAKLAEEQAASQGAAQPQDDVVDATFTEKKD